MKLFSLCTFAAILCIFTLSATEDRLTKDELFEMEEQRLSQTPDEIIKKAMPKLDYYDDDLFLDRIQKLAYTFPIGVINNGQMVRLVDDSDWNVHYLQRNQVSNWVQSDTIFIKPTASCFSNYPYVLYNRTTREVVEVRFNSMPQYYSAFRQRIVKIDPYNRIIQLDDPENTVWEISFSDGNFNRWKLGDFVIVGVNNDWRIARYPHILVNTSITGAPYCEGNFYGYGL